MEISDKLAYEMYTIVLANWIATLVIFSSIALVWIKGKKSSLKTSYLVMVSLVALWLVAKILKTVSPTIELRWFFVVVQYIGVQYLGYAFVLFAWSYRANQLPSIPIRMLLALPPTLGFLTVLTNPYHMQFYSSFTFYRDRFGPLFLPIQTFQYIYLIAGLIILIVSYKKEQKKVVLGRIFAGLSLLAMSVNIYYIAFKLDLLPWVFNFPVFDLTPIALTGAIVLFLATAYTRRFLDISPISIRIALSSHMKGLLFVYTDESIYEENSAFKQNFPECAQAKDLKSLLILMPLKNEQDRKDLYSLIKSTSSSASLQLTMTTKIRYDVSCVSLNSHLKMVRFRDITKLDALNNQLHDKNKELLTIKSHLESLKQKTKDIALLKQHRQIAQNIHDVLGHSLTVVIGSLELVALDAKKIDTRTRLSSIIEILMNSATDMKNALHFDRSLTDTSSLIERIEQLANEAIILDFTYQGLPHELTEAQNDALYKLCLEAMTNAIRHGKATQIHVILKYESEYVDIYCLDNGKGCSTIAINHGLNGILSRIEKLNGLVKFGSDGEKGFNIYASIPYKDH
jgi:signal transduction histidine kinase